MRDREYETMNQIGAGQASEYASQIKPPQASLLVELEQRISVVYNKLERAAQRVQDLTGNYPDAPASPAIASNGALPRILAGVEELDRLANVINDNLDRV